MTTESDKQWKPESLPIDETHRESEHVQRHSQATEKMEGATAKKIGQDIAYRSAGNQRPPNSASIKGAVTRTLPNFHRASMKPGE